jgi:hypothetical protein
MLAKEFRAEYAMKSAKAAMVAVAAFGLCGDSSEKQIPCGNDKQKQTRG